MIQGVDYYDNIYRDDIKYKVDYKNSPYYQIWKRTLMLIPKGSSVLDIGCGTGQYAKFLEDKAKVTYRGVDFSPVAIKIAKSICKSEFIRDDAYKCRLWKSDIVIMLEFLEHIKDDIMFLERLQSGVKFIASVPNYASKGHVRVFMSQGAVMDYYKDILNIEDIQSFHFKNRNTIYLFHGNKR